MDTQQNEQPNHEPVPLTPSKFKIGDVVYFQGFPHAEIFIKTKTGGMIVSTIGEVVDPSGVDVKVLWSANTMFEVGGVYQGIEEKDLVLADPVPDVSTLPVFDSLRTDEARSWEASQKGGESIASLMSAEITAALGEEPTPESCEAAGAMLTAARDYLLAQRRTRFGRAGESSVNANLKRLREVFGDGADDRDEPPAP